MSVSLYWIQCGGCGGDTHSFLNADTPDVVELFSLLDIDVLWHPTLSSSTMGDQRALLDKLISGETPLDFLCVEGAILRGPGGTGMYDVVGGRPKKDLVAALARQARFVIAVGTCASYGGIGADGDIDATGLQFLKWNRGGFLGDAFRSGSGLPVINLAGCPCHPEVLAGALTTLVAGGRLPLDDFNRPLEWYGMMVHQGCTRIEYHEYRVEESRFGEKGCLFFHMGCQAPLAHGPCNKLLWNRRSSKTRVGVPCVGCTQPNFPQPYPFFETRNIEGIPLELPEGVSRAHYMAYKGMAAAAAPKRLKERSSRV
jgi:uptake hydrogenase small subunit